VRGRGGDDLQRDCHDAWRRAWWERIGQVITVVSWEPMPNMVATGQRVEGEDDAFRQE